MAPQGVSAEVKQVLYHWWGAEPDAEATHFGVTVQVLIGSADRDAADSFDGIVCSPSMFAEISDLAQWGSGFTEDSVLPGGDVLPVRGVWLMRAWLPAAFDAAVARLVAASSPGPDWGTVADRIGRHLPWEYDYKHDNELNQRGGLPRLHRSFWHDEYCK